MGETSQEWGEGGEEKKSQSKRGDILDGDVSRVKRKLQRPEGSDCSSLHYKAGPLLGPGKLFSFESLLNKAHWHSVLKPKMGINGTDRTFLNHRGTRGGGIKNALKESPVASEKKIGITIILYSYRIINMTYQSLGGRGLGFCSVFIVAPPNYYYFY